MYKNTGKYVYFIIFRKNVIDFNVYTVPLFYIFYF